MIQWIIFPTQVDPFAVPDRQGVNLVPGGAAVDCRLSGFLRDMRGHTGLAQVGDEPGRIIPLVGPERQPPGRSRGMAMDHVEGGAPFRMTVGLRQVALHDRTGALLHQRRRREIGPPDRFLTLLHP